MCVRVCVPASDPQHSFSRMRLIILIRSLIRPHMLIEFRIHTMRLRLCVFCLAAASARQCFAIVRFNASRVLNHLHSAP
jgi:hypothetical protein